MNYLKTSLILSFKLINTLKSKSFVKSLTDLWPGSSSSENIFAVQNCIANQTQLNLNRFCRHESFDMIYQYIDTLALHEDIKINMSDKKGLLKSITLEQYQSIQELITQISCKFNPKNELHQAQFQTHEMLFLIADYFLVMDTIVNGTGFTKLDNLIQNLLTHKPKTFFERGYVKDLFIHDRISVFNSNNNIAYISCKKDYLSTLTHQSKQGLDETIFEVYKVA